MKKKITYAEALAELEKLAAEIESGKADPDALIEKIKRSMELVTYCRERLRETETELQKLKKSATE